MADYVQELRALVGHRPLILVAAGAIVLDTAGRVLLHRRADDGQWSIPGGALHPGESLEEAARREVREETGLELGDLELAVVYSGPEFFHEYPNGDQAYLVGAAYLAREARGIPTPQADEVTALRSFPLEALPADLGMTSRRILTSYLTTRAASGMPAAMRVPVPESHAETGAQPPADRPASVIAVLTPDEVAAEAPALVEALIEAVDDGASIGFLPPLAPDEAREYWQGVVAAQREGSRVVLVARDPRGAIIGTVQLDLAQRANGRHRAEVSRLLVRRAARRGGVARALMLALETEARRRGRTTLVLDTRQGDPSERLYQSLGYTRAGVIPEYARSADGTLAATVYYYKLLADTAG